MTTALSVHSLYVSYRGVKVLEDFSVSIPKGRLVGIVGPNGAGKSTLLKSLLGLIPKDKGRIEVHGAPMSKVRKKVAYVPQRSEVDWDFPILVLDAVLIGTYPSLAFFQRPGKKEREWAKQCLEQVGMAQYSRRQIKELSGGQQQRVFLARALAQQADLFFLDEPFVGVDAASEQTIISILRQLCREGKTVIVVHHDLNKADTYFDELIVLNQKLLAYGPVRDVMQTDSIFQAYRVQLPFAVSGGEKLETPQFS